MTATDSELIVLVDDQGRPIGSAPKLASHHAHTPLHLAFSCFVFDAAGRFLVTRRALSKKVFPGVWTNSCCGHPAPGEAIEAAIQRRLEYELGMQASQPVLALPDFRYTARYHGIVENEFCPVYLARSTQQPQPNPEEVADWLWLPWSDWLTELQRRPWRYSKWCRQETAQLTGRPELAEFIRPLGDAV
jgi:isopentenyl-diphosphate delta-isomerase